MNESFLTNRQLKGNIMVITEDSSDQIDAGRKNTNALIETRKNKECYLLTSKLLHKIITYMITPIILSSIRIDVSYLIQK